MAPMKRKVWKRRDLRKDDNKIIIRVADPQPDDVIIPIMGPTGVGKSTFINAAAGHNATAVGDNLDSCTSTIKPVICEYPGNPSRRVVFVDTPGFDDTYIDDTEILRRVAVWLALSYSDGTKVAGIIYLHEISQTRMLGTSRKNLAMFNKLCGKEAVKDVILATTKWSHVTKEIGERREQQLRGSHWKKMVEHGSRMARFEDTHGSAWHIADLILNTGGIDALLIQKELVDLDKRIPVTEAGVALRDTLRNLRKEQNEALRQLKNDAETDPEAKERYKEAEERLRITLDQIQMLKVPLSARIKAVFFP